MRLGVCDYPEHVARETWLTYPERMRALGLSVVRIGEFAWSRFEPRRGDFDWAWLDEAVDALGAAGLGVVLGTPTAAPPAWLIRERPDILPVDREGRPRNFGSRRHYDYSSPAWWDESRRVVEIVARRYGTHPAVIGWQTDNEHGCHDTARSYSPAARAGFQGWLGERYGDVNALNEAWGNVFWSQDYGDFAEVGLPHLTVYDPNPSHLLDFHRYSSDRVVAYDRMQTELLRRHSPGRFVTHNFMPFFGDFDHYRAAEHLDFVSVDSYPTGVLESAPWVGEQAKRAFARIGHPDLVGFTHDLYRGLKPGPTGRGTPHWVMEQQAGPVNWAAWNPLPTPGAVRLWTLQAFAHGADTVVYFRWQAATLAQEMMHSGLLRHDGQPGRGHGEVAGLAPELAALSAPARRGRAQVALLHDYESLWAYEAQPHGQSASYWGQVTLFYTALRELGLDVDVRHPGHDLDGYAAVVAPALTLLSRETAARLEAYAYLGGQLVLGPRSGYRQPGGQVWPELPPGPLGSAVGGRVAAAESLRPGLETVVEGFGRHFTVHTWNEAVEELASDTEVLARYSGGPLDGLAAVTRRAAGAGQVAYLGAWGEDLARELLSRVLTAAGVACHPTAPGVRRTTLENLTFVQNWSQEEVEAALPGTERVLGGTALPPAGVTVFRDVRAPAHPHDQVQAGEAAP